MTDTAPLDVLKVHITGSDVKLTPTEKQGDRHTTFRTFNVVPGTPVQILGHIPDRKRAVITIVGQSTDTGFLCGSLGDASNAANPSGSMVMGAQVITLEGTDEVWFAAMSSFAVGVMSEYYN